MLLFVHMMEDGVLCCFICRPTGFTDLVICTIYIYIIYFTFPYSCIHLTFHILNFVVMLVLLLWI